MTILEKIEEVVSKYYESSDDCTKRFRYDKDENEFWIEKELEEELKSLVKENLSIEVVDAYSSCNYEVDILVVAYIDESNTLKLYTKKLELH